MICAAPAKTILAQHHPVLSPASCSPSPKSLLRPDRAQQPHRQRWGEVQHCSVIWLYPWGCMAGSSQASSRAGLMGCGHTEPWGADF